MLKYMIGGLAALTILAGVGNAPSSNPFKILDSVSAQANELDTTAPIDVVYFKLGKLVQTNKSKGIWTEYDSRGAERYKFKTSDYSSDSLVLKGTKGNVRLIVDFTKNIISGEWPGHDMSPLYEVTRIERTAVAPQPENKKDIEVTTSSEKNSSIAASAQSKKKDFSSSQESMGKPKENKKKGEISGTVPITVPPNKDFGDSLGKPVTITQVPNPSILTTAKYEYGAFEKLEGMDWIEKAQSGRVFNYRKIGHNQRSVFLYDGSRSIMIEIDLQDNKVRSGVSGDGLRPLYDIIEAGNESPIVTPTPSLSENAGAKLSYLERTSCRLKGGEVERAGILGNERCTITYEDGGDICIDSSNCEGLCIANLSPNETDVSGTCQLNDNPFGCYSEIIAGQATPTLCVD